VDADRSAVVELQWIRAAGADSCIDRAELASRVEGTVGRGVLGHAAAGGASASAAAGAGAGAATLVRGEIGPDAAGGGWLAVVELKGDRAQRRELRLAAGDCRAFDESLVLVVALMVDAASPAAHARPLALAPPRPGATVSVGVEAALASGMLPGTAVGIGLASEVAVPPLWPVAVWFDAWPVSDVLAGASGGRLGAWTAGLALCPRPWADAAWEVLVCGGGSAGAVQSDGVGLDVSSSHVRPYVQAEARAGARVRLAGPLFLRLEAGAGLPVARDAYTYTQADGSTREVFRTAVVVPLGHLALEIRPR
jgi:hypothetical protein